MHEIKASRRSLRRLENLAAYMPPRDMDVLRDIEERRYMTSGQVRRLRFGGAAAQRITNRVLNRLKGHGLIDTIGRRVGGPQGGSGDYAWALTPVGYRLLHLHEDGLPRRRWFEPSRRFEEHTLAVAEVDIRLREVAGVKVKQAQFEPASWREYNGRRLKPDYFAMTCNGDYEDFWFFEVDLGSEIPSKVAAKCVEYQDYYRSGTEQRAAGVFPRVVWVTPDKERRDVIERYIRDSGELRQKDLFLVILPEELEHTVREGAAL